MENLDLEKKHCVPCEGGVLPLTSGEISENLKRDKSSEISREVRVTSGFWVKQDRIATA